MIKIVCVGKIKEDYLVKGIEEYLKRCAPFTKINIIEAKEVNTLDEEKNKKEEGKEILSLIKDDEYVISLEIEGKQLTSVELANLINDKFTYGYPNITFVIGGSIGLSSEVISRANYHLSFGKNTYPHQLMRLILMEQIYRSFMIINNHKYHK